MARKPARHTARGKAGLPRRVEKPWGYELLWAHTDRYAGKILHVRAGERLSYQFHRVKEETLLVLRGTVELEVADGGGSATGRRRRVRLREGARWHIPPGMRHRLIACEDADVVEVSTPELDDVVRLEDAYGRAPQRAGRGDR